MKGGFGIAGDGQVALGRPKHDGDVEKKTVEMASQRLEKMYGLEAEFLSSLRRTILLV